MPVSPGLIGRESEREWLQQALARADAGNGALVLLAGEAGIGKTRLADEVAREAGVTALRGAATHGTPLAHEPVVGALRGFLRDEPNGLENCGPLAQHLGLLLPELGDPPPATDRATLVEAVRCAVATIGGHGTALVVLDDLQWSDEATLDMLAALAPTLSGQRVLVAGLYRSDEIPRGHSLRRLRTDLRRAGRLDELVLEPLPAAATTELAETLLGGPVAPQLASTVHHRTQGLPFFVEELVGALRATGAVREEGGRWTLAADGDDALVPDTVRDAVLLGLADLDDDGRAALEAAAVAGERFDLELVAGLAGDTGLAELLERGAVVECGPGRAAFRHALARDAVYADVPWTRRRTLHRRAAEWLDGGTSSLELAGHWLGANDQERAREALVASIDEFCAVHAYRDAARAGRQALDLWPADAAANGDARLATLERYAASAELAGELAEAARAWREVEALREEGHDLPALGDARRRLAGVHDLQGERERAFAAREGAAAAFAEADLPADAAVERLVVAGYLQSSADHSAAAELARTAAGEAERAGRIDLRARALGLEGVARAKSGDYDGGLETVRSGLALALEHDLTAPAAEVTQRLSSVFEVAAAYGDARAALDSAIGLCEQGGGAAQEQVCLGCMAYVLRELGDWSRSEDLCRSLMADGSSGPGIRVVSDGILGAIHVFRGDTRAARRLLTNSLGIARMLNVLSMQADGHAALAMVESAEGDHAAAVDHCRSLLTRWERSEDVHYAVWGLRWAASYLARRGEAADAHACAEALGRVAADTGHTDALAALAHAIGETALMSGDTATAVDQFRRALDLHVGLDMPFERAQIALRAGAALAAAGEREPALERLTDAYRTARGLGAKPLATEAAAEVAALGEPLERRLGRRAAEAHESGGLSRREVEVLRLVAVGRTNREIAGELFVSPRTVEMHVRNILAKLGCRSRTEATGRAHELGLLT